MKPYNEERLGALEQGLRNGLKQRAQDIRPEAQVFWALFSERLAKKRRDKEQSKPL